MLVKKTGHSVQSVQYIVFFILTTFLSIYLWKSVCPGPDIFTTNELFICGIVAYFNPHRLAVQSYHAYLSRMLAPVGTNLQHSSVRWMTIL